MMIGKNGNKIKVSESNGMVITDRKCSKCGTTLRLSEVLDYSNLCEDCQ
ncbi:TPA: hypothetical protein ACXDAY_002293 [Clostridium botulinum]|nr:hypothetical protein [Clostridium botulinum]APH21050.1 hypothetical protein NPD1_4078 [Clostridium botulinum]APQ71227.1 hypothetical protein RSJ8_4314 [Clostridium botulinum]APR02422.1 hypothetical protein RSJ2_4178 [Clostridium botulinum]